MESAGESRRSVRIEPLDPKMIEALRAMTERQRLEVAWDMWRSARGMIVNLLRAEHPDWSEREVALEAGRRLLGQAGASRADREPRGVAPPRPAPQIANFR
ncbi:MAG: hypothetical protein AB7O68_04950 [Pirellulales bacterium]